MMRTARRGLKRTVGRGLLLAATIATCACGGSEERKIEGPLPTHQVVYGGDFTLGRRINEALFDERRRNRILEEVRPILRGADLAIINGEGVIATGGRFTDKDEPRPYMFRAHPNVLQVLGGAGIDVVNGGNNHSGDYGREALVEQLDLLRAAGIDYVGVGYDARDARTPAYRVLGDTVVAVVGADLTYPDMYAATDDEAGSLFHYAFRKTRDEDALVEDLLRVHEAAREHAHVVLFTPHWGDCWVDAPTEELRRIARRLIRGGYDGILGHSSHWLHGVELIDGKPVIYDAGNLVLDYGGGNDAHKAMLWSLDVTRRGVERIEGHPLWLRKNRALLAEGKQRDQVFALLEKRAKALGTDLEIGEKTATLDCDPGPVRGPEGTPAPPKRDPLDMDDVRRAPNERILAKLPDDATPLDVRYENGIRLVGYRMLADEITRPKGGQIVALYWTVDEPVRGDYQVHLEARGVDKKGRPSVNSAHHIPGDWMLPAEQWPPGKIIQDWTLFRLTHAPKGEVKFFTGLRRRGLLEPVSADRELVDDRLVPLGKAVYSKDAERLLDIWKADVARRSRVSAKP